MTAKDPVGVAALPNVKGCVVPGGDGGVLVDLADSFSHPPITVADTSGGATAAAAAAARSRFPT